jgi:hypothetical protein
MRSVCNGDLTNSQYEDVEEKWDSSLSFRDVSRFVSGFKVELER